MHSNRSNRAFTLIELLVVIAIIGLLASVILAALSTSRTRARDVRRAADIRQLQNSLELYNNTNANYPTTLSGLVPASIPVLPTDPLGNASYAYAALGSGTSCSSYHLGAYMELAATTGLAGDIDAAAGTECTGGGTDFSGLSAGTGTGTGRVCSTDIGTAAPSGTERCYDVKS